MPQVRTAGAAEQENFVDLQLVGLARAGDTRALRKIMQRHNQRLYRIGRSILGLDAEAEDVVQETWMKAFQALGGFRGESSLSTWLTRIAINEAVGRKRRRRQKLDLDVLDQGGAQGRLHVLTAPAVASGADPEADAIRSETGHALERAIERLPEGFRMVFVLREVEQMSVEETALQLDLLPATVKSRLHRARRLLRDALQGRFDMEAHDFYQFGGARCERVTQAVLHRLDAIALHPIPQISAPARGNLSPDPASNAVSEPASCSAGER